MERPASRVPPAAVEVVFKKARRLTTPGLLGSFIWVIRLTFQFWDGANLLFLNATCPIFRALLCRWDLQWSDNAEPEELCVRVVPNALGELRVLNFPTGIRTA